MAVNVLLLVQSNKISQVNQPYWFWNLYLFSIKLFFSFVSSVMVSCGRHSNKLFKKKNNFFKKIINLWNIKIEKLYFQKMSSNETRPYFILVRKEEEKGERFARINMELKHRPLPQSLNPFTKKAATTQTYPTRLIPAAPRKSCCFYCSWGRMISQLAAKDESTQSTSKISRPVVNLLSIFWAKVFGNDLGELTRFLSCHKVSTNFYLVVLQICQYLIDYLELELDLVELKSTAMNFFATTELDPICKWFD